MKAEYRNSIRSEKMIKQALLNLLQKRKDFSTISVSDIANEAQINRGTFYNHYQNISDVVNEIEDDSMSNLENALKGAIKDENPMSSVINIIESYLQANDQLYRTIINYIPDYIFTDMKAKMLKGLKANVFPLLTDSTGKQMEVQVYLLANGFVGTYLDYLRGNIKITLSEFIANSASLFSAIMMAIKMSENRIPKINDSNSEN